MVIDIYFDRLKMRNDPTRVNDKALILSTFSNPQYFDANMSFGTNYTTYEESFDPT
jgi:hypothetical protein